MASTILKPYERRRDPGPVSRFLLGAALVFVAMLYGLMVAVLPPQMLSYPAVPILIMMGIILWLLPDIGGVHYDQLQRLIIPYIAISVAWPSYVAFNLPGLPWISLTRLALFMVLAVFLWNFSTSREMRERLQDSVSEAPLAMKFFWLYWATTTFSLLFAKFSPAAISKYINNQIYWTMAFYVTAMLATRPGFVSKLARTFVISTGIVIVYSLYEYRIGRVPWIDYLPSFLKIDPELLETLMDTQARAGTDVYRVRGPYAASLYFSEFLTMAFPFFLHFTSKERRVVPLMALIAGTMGCMVVMKLTDARSAILGIVVASILYMFYSAARHRALSPRSIVATTVLVAYPILVTTAVLLVTFWRRAHVMILGGGEHQGSSDARAEQWRMAIPKLLSHPFGYGVGRGNDALGYFNLGGEGTVDSYYITVMMDSGVLALPLFLLTFLVPAWLAFKYYRDARTPEQELLAPLSLAIINFAIVKSVLTSEASKPLAFAFIGCIIGLIWQRHRLPEANGEPAVAEPSLAPLPRPKLIAARTPPRRPAADPLALPDRRP